MAAFDGFSRQTFDFLEGLTEHNDKSWFDEHRADYEAHYLAPAKLFVTAMGERLAVFSPHVSAVPQVNKSIFRINRNVRFSKDKTPYKNHIDLWFHEGENRRSVSGYFFRLLPDRVLLGAGAHAFDTAALNRFRAAVIRPESAAALTCILSDLEAGDYVTGAVRYKTVPRGYDDHKGNGLLRYDCLHAALETTVPDMADIIDRPVFADWCADRYRPLQPLHAWLTDHVA